MVGKLIDKLGDLLEGTFKQRPEEGREQAQSIVGKSSRQREPCA